MSVHRLLYSENENIIETQNTGSKKSIYYDFIINGLIIENLFLNILTSSIANTNGILCTNSNGNLTNIANGIAGQYLQSDGTNWAFKTINGTLNGSYLEGSDLSGLLSSPIVKNISNITNGTLSALNGGTGVSSFTQGGIAIKDSSNTIKFLIPNNASSILRSNGNGGWVNGGATNTNSYNIQANYYTCLTPGQTTSYEWTKPVGISNIVVILMAGGGGGGGGGRLPGVKSGGGGGAGGLSRYELKADASTTQNFVIIVGGGGAGGATDPVNVSGPASNPGEDGHASYVYITDGKIGTLWSYGGKGGKGGNGTPDIPNGYGGAAGWGNLTRGLGGDGSTRNTTGYNDSYIGSGGGAAGSYNSAYPVAAFGGDSLILNSTTAPRGATVANVDGTPGGSTAISLGIPPYTLYIGGGGGGGTVSPGGRNGGNGIYGSGGGGAGAATTATTTSKGGNGGDGYVLLMYW